jgi:hypothetical protein
MGVTGPGQAELPATFRFMGTPLINRPPHGGAQVQGGTSVLQQALVPGPGIVP